MVKGSVARLQFRRRHEVSGFQEPKNLLKPMVTRVRVRLGRCARSSLKMPPGLPRPAPGEGLDGRPFPQRRRPPVDGSPPSRRDRGSSPGGGWHAPIRELALREGRILLIGVGLNRMTAIHLAEQQSGRRLFLSWARAADGRIAMYEVGSCSEGFPRLEPALGKYAHPAIVGGSQWRAFPTRQVLEAASSVMREDQSITACGNSDCLLCRDSIAGGPIESVLSTTQSAAS